jgi:hypothetical protein
MDDCSIKLLDESREQLSKANELNSNLTRENTELLLELQNLNKLLEKTMIKLSASEKTLSESQINLNNTK